MDTLLIESVNHGFHGNITCQVPVILIPVLTRIHMAEKAVEQHVQIRPVYQTSALAEQAGKVLRPIVDEPAVRGNPAAAPVSLESKTAQGHVQEPHVQI